MLGIDFVADEIHALFSHEVCDNHGHLAKRTELATDSLCLVLFTACQHHTAACFEHHAGSFQTHTTGTTYNKQFFTFEKIAHFILQSITFPKVVMPGFFVSWRSSGLESHKPNEN
ncbi:hypothetical protein D3C85_1085150 [compost metagenome]